MNAKSHKNARTVTLTANHHRMIHTYAMQIHKRSGGRQPLADIKQAGYLALCEAAQQHDPNKGSLETFSYLRVRGAMLDEAVRADWQPSYRRRRNGGGPMVDVRQTAAIYAATIGTGHNDATKGGAAQLGRTGGTIMPILVSAPMAADSIDIKRVLQQTHFSAQEQAIIRKHCLEGRLMMEVAQEIGVNKFNASRIRAAMVRRLQEELGIKS